MELDMKHKAALVTGAGSGIGRAIAHSLAQAGAKVMIVGRTEATLKETAKLDPNIFYKRADITSTEDVSSVVREVKEKFGRLNVLINNAGVAPVTALKTLDLKEFDLTFSTNVRAAIDLTKQALSMLQKSRGNVVNISSTAARTPLANMSIYSASKAALYALTRAWAKELAADGIRVNSVAVGPIETPIYGKTDLSDEGAQQHRKFVLDMIPMKHFGMPEDVASIVLFLASNEAKFITGADFVVDGGVCA